MCLRQVAAFLGGMGYRVSRESVRRWFLKAGELFSRNRVGRRGFIVADETVIYDLAGKAYLWAAREVRSGEVVAVQVTKGRGVGECLRFLERVRGAATTTPQYTPIGLHGTSGLQRY